jgi:hypothetical protein
MQTTNDDDKKPNPEAEKFVSGTSKSIDHLLWSWLVIIVLAILTPFFLLPLKPESETVGLWIQRSGTIIIALSLLAEIKALAAERLAMPANQFLYCNMQLKEKYSGRIKTINWITYIVIASGTAICGFGEILAKPFLK